MDTKRDYQGIFDTLSRAKKVLISTHKSPDGDAVGSSLAMHHYLNALGVDHVMVVPDEFPYFLNWLSDADLFVRFDKNSKEVNILIEECDVLVSLDYNILSRTGKEMGEALTRFKGKRIMIDHHRQPDETFDFYVHDIESCSTAQLVFDLMANNNRIDAISIDLAESIYTGILTDTGSFRFPSTTAHTHEVVAQLIKKGLSVSKVYNAIYDTNSYNRLRLLGYVLGEKMTLHPNKTTAYFSLTLEELERYNYKPGDTEGFVNYALSIAGVRFACIMKEASNGTKMSFRSKGDWDVNVFARTHFNGGGHLNAAGGFCEKNLQETETQFLETLKKYPELLT